MIYLIVLFDFGYGWTLVENGWGPRAYSTVEECHVRADNVREYFKQNADGTYIVDVFCSDLGDK